MAKDTTTTMAEVLCALVTLAEAAFTEGYAAGYCESLLRATGPPRNRRLAWDASQTKRSLDAFKRFLTATVQP